MSTSTSHDKDSVAADHKINLDEKATAETRSTRDASLASSDEASPAHGDIEKGTPVTAVEEDDQPDPADPNVVDWDGPDDPENPMNW